jgi:hypothetical protein
LEVENTKEKCNKGNKRSERGVWVRKEEEVLVGRGDIE